MIPSIEDFPNHAPSVCFLCESAEPGAKFIRTGQVFEPGVFTRVNGIKYICSNCARDAASAFGLFDDMNATYLENLSAHAAHIVELEDKLKSYKIVSDLLTSYAASVTHPAAPAKKKAPAKAPAE